MPVNRRLFSLFFIVLFIYLGIGVSFSDAQVPRICVENATQVNGTCCPSIPDQPTLGPCGGKSRGQCSPVKVVINDSRSIPEGSISDVYDNRMDWPVHMFRYMCKCTFFYSGIACENSKIPTGGLPWQIFTPTSGGKPKRIRKNALNLTAAEQQRFVDVLSKSKEVLSDFVILNETKMNADGTKNISYFNVSVYDYYVFLNYYATKGVPSGASTTASSKPLSDYAHKGPNFVPWHRTLLALFEAELSKIADSLPATSGAAASTEPFALPFWEWTNKTTCEVCTDALVGAIDGSDSLGRLSAKSPFSKWQVLCNGSNEDRHPCDPSADRPVLSRAYSNDPLYKTLPSVEDVRFMLNATAYDSAPYNEFSDNTSFRNLLEGYVGRSSEATTPQKLFMGMQVRQFLQGTWTDLSLGPNDPIFWLHQAYLDHLFDLWQTANKDTTAFDFPPGATIPAEHNRDQNLVGFIPARPAFVALKFSTSLFGYNYDNSSDATLLTATGIAKAVVTDPAFKKKWHSIIWSLIGATGLVVLITLIFVTTRRHRMYKFVSVKSEKSELTPLVTYKNV